MERLIKAIHINVPTGTSMRMDSMVFFPPTLLNFSVPLPRLVGAGYYLIDGNFQVRFNFGGKFRPEQIRIGPIPVSSGDSVGTSFSV
ncbi:MAG: hypothetical protein JKP90_21530 [Desulfofustis sp. PB-SRB1]|nr:hypothetical protein [Desulfofustis sp. PB-SRB1]